jgi:DNA polymerase-3 subunit delta'
MKVVVNMLDEFKEKQDIVYKQLKNALNGNLSHAYLFNTNTNVNSDNIILSFIKSILCPHNYTNSNKCESCSTCERIDNGNYPEIKNIRPEGLWIKKEQLMELQKDFSTKAIEGNKRIYIIYEAEKLNKQAANSLLKFLEEPAADIIAVLVTDKINLMMDTIISRCQTIIFKKNKLEEYAKQYETNNNTLIKLFFVLQNGQDVVSYISDQKNKLFLDNVIEYITKQEECNIKMIINTKKFFHDKFVSKEEVDYAFELIILFYKDVINYKIRNKVNIFDDYIDSIKYVANKNNKSVLLMKLNKIIEIKDLIKNNVNSNLLIDKLIIEIEGGVSYV